MTMILAILTHTAPWVYALLALLVLIGLRALKPRTMTLGRMVLIPVGFILWGLSNLFTGPTPAAALLEVRGLAAVLAFAVAWFLPPLRGVTIDRAKNLVHVPGSAIPLVRNIGIFVIKYMLAVVIIMNPADSTPKFVDAAISGLISGYFLGWLVRLIVKFQAPPVAEPT